MSYREAQQNENEEAARLASLDSYGILDTVPEQGFDDLVLLATQLCKTPVSLVSFVASDRQWFKARIGFDPCQTPLSQSVCALALRRPGLCIIPDLTLDPRTRENTLVTATPHIRFYAGARLETPEGSALGSLCVIDTKPRPKGLTLAQQHGLQALARQVMAQLELRRSTQTLEARVAELARQRSQTWLVTPDLLSVINADGSFESTNPAWETTLGWTETELKTSYVNFVHPDDIERSAAVFEDAKRGNPMLHFENRYRRKGDGYCWLSWVAVLENGKIYCSARDITAEKLQAAALEERTADRDRAWRLSQDLIVIVSPDGTLDAVNAAWTRLLGWTESELIGRSFVDFTHPDDLEPTLSVFASIFEKPLVTPYEYRLRHKNGTFQWFAWSGSFEAGKVYANGRHVSAEHDHREALQRAEEQLRQSQKMEAVGQLTGGLAHDFNNLLTVVMGSLELLEQRVLQGRLSEIEQFLVAAQSAARRATGLTHRLLAFSRRQTLDPKATAINQLIAGMDDLIRRTVGPAIAVETVGAGGLWTTLVDPHQLENALLNLCINARDAMPDGGRLTIETANRWLDDRAARERDLAPGQYVSLCVSDTGCGMPPDVIAKAFDPFFTTKPIGQGTGLGLSMVYGFARQSDGQVRIYSEVGQGAMVCVYLPRHYGHEVDGAETNLAAPEKAEQGDTVLVVDDEPGVRMIVGEVLGELGYGVIEAEDGAAALKVVASHARIDLLVTDVGLPGGMNGRQVADAARTSRPNLKVLFITGYAENAVVGNGHLDPGMAVITKPFAMDALANRIKALIADKAP